MAGCGGSAKESASSSAGSASSPRGGADTGMPGVGGAGVSHDDGPVALGGSNAGAGSPGAGNSASVSSQGGAGAGTCDGDFDKVAAIWGDCPPTLCAALASAESCNAIPQTGVTTRIETCDALTVITHDFSTHGKACYYSNPGTIPGAISAQEPKLVGATAWDDVPTYCDRTSNSIKTGAQCSGASLSRILCDGSSNADGAAGANGGEDTAPEAGPRACFNLFSHSCEPCCPTQTPECTGKPDGYPGYRCTQAANSYCSCACASEQWSCGC